ncbi:MAG: tRNA (adenosine(37)-N6)-threonylcarbamoyltransferase complex transferase subunit TsaD [Firmicutes bacterium]|nr:tRNA (adenosine(37)-N6)-threonylcarbamoyltransferase complex transferase subunit TsaD [Bacillota bacterium]
MLILGIESSCDETSVAIVEDGRKTIANLVLSQLDVHRDFGGVVPELACRMHLEIINPLIEQALEQSGLKWEDIDAIAVTHGPGLVGAVLIGVAAAKALAYSLNKPLIGVNHLEGHIYANHLEEGEMAIPAISLLVSGGHTSLVLVRDHGNYEIVGETRDDAAGEAFDKVARMLGLGYPGGPVIDKTAKAGNPDLIRFPRAMTESRDNFDFSFSGLKTAVVYYLKSEEGKKARVEDIAAGFQEAAVDVLVKKTVNAAKKFNVKDILLAGGVARNSRLREKMAEKAGRKGIKVHLPSPILCTDNAAMIATAGYFLYKRGIVSDLGLDALPNLPLPQCQ